MDLELKTERLILRAFRPEDGPRIRELAGVWDVAKMLVSLPHPYPEGVAETWIATHDKGRRAGSDYPFAVTRDGDLVGCVALEKRGGVDMLEIGYWLGLPYWGKGYATEAAQAAVDFAFGWLGADRLRAHHMLENAASARVLRKLGFVAVGQDQSHSRSRGTTVDTIDLILKREDYLAKSGIT